MLNNSTTPPDKGWFLQTRRTLTLGNQVFPAGAKVSAADCGRNLRTHLDTGAVWWAPPGTPIAAKPAKLPTPAKLQPLPTLEFIDIPDDPEASWRQTLALMTERCGSHAAAMDLLMGNAQARALCKLATRVACTTEAKRRKCPLCADFVAEVGGYGLLVIDHRF
jgi:hypothetical protein